MPLTKTDNSDFEKRALKPEEFAKLMGNENLPVSFSKFIKNVKNALSKHVKDTLERKDVSGSDKKLLKKCQK